MKNLEDLISAIVIKDTHYSVSLSHSSGKVSRIEIISQQGSLTSIV